MSQTSDRRASSEIDVFSDHVALMRVLREHILKYTQTFSLTRHTSAKSITVKHLKLEIRVHISGTLVILSTMTISQFFEIGLLGLNFKIKRKIVGIIGTSISLNFVKLHANKIYET